MNQLELQKTANELILQLNQKYPSVLNGVDDTMIRVVEYKGVKYEIDYEWSSGLVTSIYKAGDDYTAIITRGDSHYTCKGMRAIISSIKSILKGTEIQDGPILQVVENNKTIPYYSATIRFECEIDAQRMMGVFSKLNDWSLDRPDFYGYMILLNEYQGSKSTYDSPTAKLTISSEYSINDIKAILLNFDKELLDCHVAIQSLDYAQFEGARDRSSHYPSDELVQEWSNKLTQVVTK